MGVITSIFNPKWLIGLTIIIGAGYLATKFPDEAVLILGCGIIIITGYWLYQAYSNESARN